MCPVPSGRNDDVWTFFLCLPGQLNQMVTVAAFQKLRLNAGAVQHLKRLRQSAAGCPTSSGGIE